VSQVLREGKERESANRGPPNEQKFWVQPCVEVNLIARFSLATNYVCTVSNCPLYSIHLVDRSQWNSDGQYIPGSGHYQVVRLLLGLDECLRTGKILVYNQHQGQLSFLSLRHR